MCTICVSLCRTYNTTCIEKQIMLDMSYIKSKLCVIMFIMLFYTIILHVNKNSDGLNLVLLILLFIKFTSSVKYSLYINSHI